MRLFALLLVLAVLSFSSFTFGLVSAIASEIPALDPTKQPELNGYIYANDGKTVLAVLRGEENRVLVETEQIAPIMRQAIVAVEDRRFFDHRGIDVRGIARAAWADIQNKAFVEGGSTITQQFVKNTQVDADRTVSRKVREAALAWQLEQRWDKNRILTAYLNTIYFGNGAYGIQQASRIYFGHGASQLTLTEAALLAGIPADPTTYDPITSPQHARDRREVVLRTMLDQGYITEDDFAKANSADLPTSETITLPGTQGPAPFFTNYVKQQLVDRYTPGRVFGAGLRVTTTIDLKLQELARSAISESLTEEDGPSAALVAIDPTSGDVLAMVGGNYRESQFNLAVQGERQPGSAFKPFVLASALQQGVAPTTMFESKKLLLPLGDKYWSVENYEDAYLGRIDLETATVHSDNAVYAELTRLVGPAAVARTAKRLGVTSPLRDYFSIGLGAQAANPLELARAYSAFANGGVRIDTKSFGNRPRAIASIAAEDGSVIDENKQVTERVLTPATAAYVNQMLQRAVEQGTGQRAALPNQPVAGKTGTTENYGDAWFVGYTPHLVVAVWVGYPNTLKPMLTEFDGEPVSGGSFPALIWKSFVEKALPHLGKEPESFEPPPSLYAAAQRVVRRDGKLALDNGVCREAVEVVYFAGFGPKGTADCKENEVEVPRVIGMRLENAKQRLALQPLESLVVYKPAKPGQRVDVVHDQLPKGGGRLSSHDRVTLVLAKPQSGTVPDVEGMPLLSAREKLLGKKLTPRVIRYVDGPAEVVSQKPGAHVAAGQGMTVELVVGRG